MQRTALFYQITLTRVNAFLLIIYLEYTIYMYSGTHTLRKNDMSMGTHNNDMLVLRNI